MVSGHRRGRSSVSAAVIVWGATADGDRSSAMSVCLMAVVERSLRQPRVLDTSQHG